MYSIYSIYVVHIICKCILVKALQCVCTENTAEGVSVMRLIQHEVKPSAILISWHPQLLHFCTYGVSCLFISSTKTTTVFAHRTISECLYTVFLFLEQASTASFMMSHNLDQPCCLSGGCFITSLLSYIVLHFLLNCTVSAQVFT